MGIIGLPTVGLIATNHVLLGAAKRGARAEDSLAATSVAYEAAQSYQQRLQVLRNVPGNPDLTTGLADGDQTALRQTLETALEDGQYCRLALRSPGIAPVMVSAGGPCWSPPEPSAEPSAEASAEASAEPSAGPDGISTLGTGVVDGVAFTGWDLTGAVPGHPTATLQAVFAVHWLVQAVVPGAGTHTTLVSGTTIVSSNTPAAVGQPVATAAALAMVHAGRPATATIFSPLIHTNVIVAYQPVPDTGLGVFFSVTTKVAYASAAHVRRILLYLNLGIVAIGLSLAALVVVMLRRRELARDRAARRYRAAEAAIARAEARQRTTIETVDDGIVVYEIDEQGHHFPVLMNPAMARISGYSFDQSLEMSATRAGPDLVDTDGRPTCLDDLPVAVAARTGQSARAVFGLRNPESGERVWLRTAANPVRDDQGATIGIVSSTVDITEERAARANAEDEQARFAALAADARRSEQELRASEERFRLAFENAPIGKALIGPDGRFQQVNQALCDITGHTDEQLRGVVEADITHPDDQAADAETTARMLAGEATAKVVDKRFITASGAEVWVARSASLVRCADGSPLQFIAQFQEITERKRAQDALIHQSLHDPLTGLANRTLFQDRVEHALAAATRSRTQIGVLYIDLDGFKQVNDCAGHAAGDQLLVQVADRLRRIVRPGDTVARMGGDEFAIVCVDTPDLDSLRVVASRALKMLRAPFKLTSSTQRISASIGLAISDTTSGADQVLSDADAGMYRAKQDGKDRIAGPCVEDQARAARIARIMPELSEALVTGQLVMYGQPVVDLATGATVAVETLIRWNHPVRNILAPNEFLDVAEQTPLMIRIGQRALDESCRMAAAWSKRFGPVAPDVHVNVSGRQLESGHFTSDVLAALRYHSLPATQLVLELTETHLPTLSDSLLDDIDALRDRGIRIAIDDLGTGYSSLARIIELPVDILKIDLRFTAGLGRDPACDAVVRAVLNIGQAMDLLVIAEGVENAHQAELLATHGCRTAQGYLYSRPQPEPELLRYLTEHTPIGPAPHQLQRHTAVVGS